MLPLLLIFELILLFFLSKRLTQNLFLFLYRLTRSRSFAVSIITLLLFPGTVVHELSHLFTAEILGVRTGKLILAPEAIRGEKIQAGSVAIAQTGPFRRALIGLAPVIAGLGVLTAISTWLPGLIQNVQIDTENGVLFSQKSLYFLLFAFYCLFAVSNSMFSSNEDLKGFLPLATVIALVAAAAWYAGLRFSLAGPALSGLNQIFSLLIQSLSWVLAVNLVFLLTAKALIALAKTVLRTYL